MSIFPVIIILFRIIYFFTITNITVCHYNANTDHFNQLLDYSKQNKYRTLINVACPSGMWSKVHDEVCDEEDQKHIKQLRNSNLNNIDIKHNSIEPVGIACRT